MPIPPKTRSGLHRTTARCLPLQNPASGPGSPLPRRLGRRGWANTAAPAGSNAAADGRSALISPGTPKHRLTPAQLQPGIKSADLTQKMLCRTLAAGSLWHQRPRAKAAACHGPSPDERPSRPSPTHASATHSNVGSRGWGPGLSPQPAHGQGFGLHQGLEKNSQSKPHFASQVTRSCLVFSFLSKQIFLPLH